MAFATIEASAVTNRTAAETTSPVMLPSLVSPGATLLVIGGVAATGAVGWPDGTWNEFGDFGVSDRLAYAWKKATGTEDGTSINVTHGSAKSAWIACSIIDAADPTVQPPEDGNTSAVGTSTLPNPPAVTPTGGAKDYLWIWIGEWEGEQTSPPAGTPTNYTNPIAANTGTASATATNCRVAIASRQLNAAVEDPPTWTISASASWMAVTIAIYPGAPPVGVGTRFVRSQAVQRASRW